MSGGERGVVSWAAPVLGLAAASVLVVFVLKGAGEPLSRSGATLLAVAVPTLLAPLFWPREAYTRHRLLQGMFAPALAALLVAGAIWLLRRTAPSPEGLATALLVTVTLLAVAHMGAALLESLLTRAGADASFAREWSYWTVTAALWLTASAPLWLGPAADLGARTHAHAATLALGVSPLAHLASAAGYDLLRNEWFYGHTGLGALQLDYPRVAVLLAGYVAAACVLALLARPVAAQAVLLLVALGGFPGDARAQPADFDVIAAWGGWSRPGRITEIEVRVQAEGRGTAQLRVASGRQTVRTEVRLEPGRPARVSIPVAVAELLAVELRLPGDRDETRELRFALSESPLLAWAATPPVVDLPGSFHAVAVEGGALPRTASAYSSIDALVVERRLMSSLAQDQLEALVSYVAACGRTVVVDASPADAGLLGSAVGCGGRNFAVVAGAGEAGGRLQRMLAAASEEPPEATSLTAILGPNLRAWYLAAALLAASAAGTVLAGVFSTSIAAAVAVPALAAACVLAFAQTRMPDDRLVVWAESGADEHLAQYRGLYESSLARRGTAEIPVLSALARPRSCDAGARASWSWDAAARRFTRVRMEGRLLSRVSLCYAGEFPVARSATMRTSPSGRLVLSNPGEAESPAGTLVWGGRLYRVRALGPAAAAEFGARAGTSAATRAEATALARTAPEVPAMLWPLDLGRVAGAPAQSQAWLLVDIVPHGGGSSP